MTEILDYGLVYNGRYILNYFHNDTVTVYMPWTFKGSKSNYVPTS